MRNLWFWFAMTVSAACLLTGPAFGMDMMGEHDMSGTVQKVNHKTGTFELKTHEGVLRLHFPPDSVKEVKNGDTLTVHLGFKKGDSGMPMR